MSTWTTTTIDLCARGPRLVAALLCLSALGSTAAYAHQQGISYSDVAVADGRVRYDLTLSSHDLQEIDIDHDGNISENEVLAQYPALRRHFEHALVVQAGDEPCPLTLQDFLLDPSGTVTFRLRGPCGDGAPLRIAFQLLALSTAPGYDFAKIAFRGAFTQKVFTREDTTVVIGAADESPAAMLRRFLVLGLTDVATSYEHVLFLIALLVIGGGIRSMVGVLAAWTVAFSVTLILSALEIVVPPTRLIEAAIALSIVWVALENVLFDPSPGRWRLAFLLGLVHGFGFAAVLREVPLPPQHVATSLAAFIGGLGLGQLGIVAVAFPAIAMAQRVPRRRVVVATASCAILLVALWRLIERAFLA